MRDGLNQGRGQILDSTGLTEKCGGTPVSGSQRTARWLCAEVNRPFTASRDRVFRLEQPAVPQRSHGLVMVMVMVMVINPDLATSSVAPAPARAPLLAHS